MNARSNPYPTANPEVVLQEQFDNWAVLFNPINAEAVGINAMGIAIWNLLDGDRDLEAITGSIQSRFAGVPGDARAQIEAFLDELLECGFIHYDE